MAKPGTYTRDGETRVATDKPTADRMTWDGWAFVEPKEGKAADKAGKTPADLTPTS